MNEKVMLTVSLPATQQAYDFWVPKNSTLHDAAELIGKVLESREGDRFCMAQTNTLMLQETGDLLDHNQTIAALGFVNGVKLVLV